MEFEEVLEHLDDLAALMVSEGFVEGAGQVLELRQRLAGEIDRHRARLGAEFFVVRDDTV